jgi:FMN phosphatase YigB (HAD superfamily)
MTFQAVLLDLGGVLTVDPWESLLLTAEVGGCARLGIEPAVLEPLAVSLWPRFATTHREEAQYWSELEGLLGLTPGALGDLVGDLEELLRPNPRADEVLSAASEHPLGLVSDNTSFFFPRQDRLLGLGGLADPTLTFLSHEVGLSKSARPGLFEHVSADLSARGYDLGQVLVVDNRVKHVEHAASLGFAFHHLEDFSDAATDLLLERLQP